MLINNDFIETKIIWDNFFIKTISNLKLNGELKDFVKQFINIKSFPYINTDYGEILEEYSKDLTLEQKIEVVGHLENLLISLNAVKKEAFMKKTNKELSELTETEIESIDDKEELFNSFRGGEYAEMFLSQMLYSIGLEKVLSKLAIQWGDLSPTGIDIPYIDVENKILVLCESKFWKTFNSAFKSIKKDIDSIVDSDKFDKELLEWKKRVSGMPSKVKSWYIENLDNISNKTFFETEFEIIVLGVTICNKIDEEKIKNAIVNEFGQDLARKYKIILMSIPIEDKNKLISICEECVKEVLDVMS